MSCSDYLFKLFRLFLIVCSQRGNNSFPTWERFIPKEGTSRSHDGNKCKKQLSRIIIWRNEDLCVPLPDYIVVVECIYNNSRHCVRILFLTTIPNSRPCRIICDGCDYSFSTFWYSNRRHPLLFHILQPIPYYLYKG